MESAKTHPKQDSYKENHHIIPLCVGGSNDASNLVQLTARQHYLAHWLLYKIHKTSKLVHAWNGMSRIGRGQEKRRQNSHLFERAKKERNKVLSESMMGDKNWMKTHPHTQEIIDKILRTREETYKKDPERKKRANESFAAGVSKRWKGVPKTKESNIKRGRPNLIRLKNKDTGEYIRISRNEKDNYDSSIWKNPYSIRDKKYGICPHCGKESELNNTFRRWHFDNCKLNPKYVEPELIKCPFCGKEDNQTNMGFKSHHFDNCKHK
jgi:endogenous inhibitor of DNA gyrase (YacG/DUF329 family)